MKERSLPAELFAHLSFSLAVRRRERKRERQKEDGRNETKTCTGRGGRKAMQEWRKRERDANEKSAA